MNQQRPPAAAPTESDARLESERDRGDAALWAKLAETPDLLHAIQQAQHVDPFALQRQLRTVFSPELVRSALLLTDLRKRAAEKFSAADKMWFDRLGYEQSTGEAVARHKSLRFRQNPGLVWDLCCGIGADAMILAEEQSVVAVDRRETACQLTRLNLANTSQSATVRCEDVTTLPLTEQTVHIDPDRRSELGRSRRIELYQPGLPWLQELCGRAAGGGIKLSPASNFGGKFPDTEIELISVDGECKEAVVWFGTLRGPVTNRATVLSSRGASASVTADPWAYRPNLRPLMQYLYDPDPAVVRAGLVDAVAEQLGLFRLDDAEEYLTAATLVTSPFVRAFEVRAEVSHNDRAIRDWFRSSDVGQVEIKCRHVPVAVDVLRRRLPLPGSTAAVLFVARLQGHTRYIAARRVSDRADR